MANTGNTSAFIEKQQYGRKKKMKMKKKTMKKKPMKKHNKKLGKPKKQGY
tara:strand:- start:3654 stop:3803 length:150 start_codon:yes stop_codon:yes gene_type:complete